MASKIKNKLCPETAFKGPVCVEVASTGKKPSQVPYMHVLALALQLKSQDPERFLTSRPNFHLSKYLKLNV